MTCILLGEICPRYHELPNLESNAQTITRKTSILQSKESFVPKPLESPTDARQQYLGTLGHMPTKQRSRPEILPRQARDVQFPPHSSPTLVSVYKVRSVRTKEHQPVLQIPHANISHPWAIIQRAQITDMQLHGATNGMLRKLVVGRRYQRMKVRKKCRLSFLYCQSRDKERVGFRIYHTPLSSKRSVVRFLRFVHYDVAAPI